MIYYFHIYLQNLIITSYTGLSYAFRNVELNRTLKASYQVLSDHLNSITSVDQFKSELKRYRNRISPPPYYNLGNRHTHIVLQLRNKASNLNKQPNTLIVTMVLKSFIVPFIPVTDRCSLIL